MLKPFLLATCALLTLACGGAGDAETSAPTGESAAPKAQTVALESAVRELKCGCKIESIGHCGNYVADGDDWLEINNPDAHGLGKMEWCGATEKVEGTVAGTRDGSTVKLDTLTIAGK